MSRPITAMELHGILWKMICDQHFLRNRPVALEIRTRKGLLIDSALLSVDVDTDTDEGGNDHVRLSAEEPRQGPKSRGAAVASINSKSYDAGMKARYDGLPRTPDVAYDRAWWVLGWDQQELTERELEMWKMEKKGGAG